MFKRKFQIKSALETFTVGDCLRQRREEAGFSIKDVSIKLGIKKEYLESLEGGDYRNLPPQVYVKGFIRSYASFLGIDGGQLAKIYSREISFATDRTEAAAASKLRENKLKDYLTVTPQILTIAVSLIVVSMLGYYFYHQINSFNSKPYLFVDSPSSDEVVKEKDLLVSGKTEKDAILKINGQDVIVGENGIFSQKIVLSEGKNFLMVEARNRFNKLDRKEITVIYEKQEGDDKTIIEMPAIDAENSNSESADKNANTPGFLEEETVDATKKSVPVSGSGNNFRGNTSSATDTVFSGEELGNDNIPGGSRDTQTQSGANGNAANAAEPAMEKVDNILQ